MSSVWATLLPALLALAPKILEYFLGRQAEKSEIREMKRQEKKEANEFKIEQKRQLRAAFDAGDFREFRRVRRGKLRGYTPGSP